MRIISGIHKGRKIISPKNLPVRPTTDRAKEGLFNILENKIDINSINVLDLFSGTGVVANHFNSNKTSIISNDLPYSNYVIQKTGECLNQVGKTIKNSRILLLGLAYKKNIDDIRESPSLKIMDQLLDLGANIKYSDPYIDHIPPTRKYNFQLKSVILNY